MLERCILCGSQSWKQIVTGPDRMRGLPIEYRVLKCATCGLCRTDPQIKKGERAKYYEPDVPSGAGKTARIEIYQRRLADRLQKAVAGSSGKRVLDIGCGQGVCLEMMRDRGFEAYGVELGEESARLACEERGLNVVAGDLLALQAANESFDVVLMSHLIEHVDDPIGILDRVRDLLKPGGLVLLSLPNYRCIERRIFGANWYPWCLPVHLYHFDTRSIRRAAEMAGLKVDRVAYLPFFFLAQSLRYALGKGAQTTGTTGKGVDSLKTVAFQVNLWISDLLGRFMPGEIMEIEARKPLSV